MKVTITVNGTQHESEIEPRTLLVQYVRETLGLTGTERFDISGIGNCTARSEIRISAQPVDSTDAPTGPAKEFSALVRLDGPNEVNTYRNGGIMPAVLRRMAKSS